jgi:superfamily II DNA or RNA helicase
MDYDIIIRKKNDVYALVECEDYIAHELEDFFTFYVPGYKWMPAYKNKMWDGKIRLFSIWTQEIYIGLTNYIIEFAKNHDYSIAVDDNVLSKTKITPKDIAELCSILNVHSGGNKIKHHDYQMLAIYHALKYKRAILLSPTSSGKSLIIYTICRYLQAILNKKILIIVPTVSLVSQMCSDFADYASEVKWNTDDNVHMIMGGKDKFTSCDIVISTWQSIFKMNAAYFSQFGAVIGDECHLATAKSIKGIAEKLVDCEYKIGTTGTLDDMKTSKLVLEGLFGPVKRIITTKELMDRKSVAKLKIKSLVLVYDSEEKEFMKKKKYKDEIKWLYGHNRRNFFLARLALAQKKNSLLLFNEIAHGKFLEQIMREIEPNRTIHFVDGSIPAEHREKIRHWVEKEKDSIIIASFGVFSTGVSIKNIHSVIFASPIKSKIKTLQSIGRGLRINSEKDSVILYDIVDDLSYKSHQNYALKHYLERADYYAREKFEVQSKRIIL